MEKGSLSDENVTPWEFMTAVNSPMGRSGSLPAPLKDPPPQSAEITGSRNRRVEPLSRQLQIGALDGTLGPRTVKVSPSLDITAPAAPMTSTVARISSEISGIHTRVVCSEQRAEHMSSLWASDFEETASMVPMRGEGVIFISIFTSLQLSLRSQESDASWTSPENSVRDMVMSRHLPILSGITTVILSPLRFLSDRADA